MAGNRTAASVFGHTKTVEGIRRLAQARLPRGLFEFIDRGSDDEIAIRNNCEAFDRIKFRPRVLRDVSGRTSEMTLFGEKLGMPVAIAPTGSAGIVWYRGEVELAKAAAAANVPFTLATRSMSAVETIAAEAGGNLWFQMYTLNDRALSYALLDRVRAAGFRALVITVDTPTNPSREYNERNGYSLPFKYTARGVADILRHPRWLTGVIGRYMRAGGLPRFENLPGGKSIDEGMSPTAMLSDNLTWDDLREFRRRWSGQLIVKGVLHPEDAREAVNCGADAVIVSNHGGRNLDSTMAPIEALPAVVDAIGRSTDVLVDGGIRRGSDIAKALALGAKCVLVGRATLYGTAVAGELGASYVLTTLRREFLYTLATPGLSECRQTRPQHPARAALVGAEPAIAGQGRRGRLCRGEPPSLTLAAGSILSEQNPLKRLMLQSTLICGGVVISLKRHTGARCGARSMCRPR